MIPKNITKEHIEKAIEEIDNNGVRKGRHSSTYNLVYKDKTYPPKLVISIANRYANGIELNPDNFDGGKGTEAFELLKNEGFKIIPKNDSIKSLITDYKKRIADTKLKEEIYKWELVNQYRGRPNTSAPDFYKEIKDIKFSNLIYAMGMAVTIQLAKNRPEELRKLFVNLFNEEIDLNERINNFSNSTLNIYRELGETKQHHQDERSIATYLTFHNPDKYTFYKSSYYKKYCNLLGIEEANKNEKYSHYLLLIDELIDNYIKSDKELIEQVKSLIPDFYDGTNHKLLAQDILFQMLDKNEETNYWIFQGNPKVFDFKTALQNEILTNWTVSAHKDKIKVGDKVILWITGDEAGCYALAEVTSKPHIKTSSTDDHLWKGEDKSDLKAGIKITHNLVDNPIRNEAIARIEELSELKVGNQGTNFTATQEEYDSIMELINNMKTTKYWLYAPGENASKWDKFYELGIMGLGWDEIGDLKQYKSKEEIKSALFKAYGGEGSKKNDVTANDEFLNKVKIGDIIIAKKGRGELLGYGVVSSDYKFDNSRDDYKHTRKVDWKLKGIWPVDFSLVSKTLTDITIYKSEHPDYNTFHERLMGIMTNKISETNKTMNHPINTIFYGPPGTGKTYNTIMRAAEIIENRVITSYNEALNIFKANLHNQIEFITFHQNYSYEDFIQGLRPDTENGGQLSFEKKDGIFKIIADRALKNIKESEKAPEELSKEKRFEEALESFIEDIAENEGIFKITENCQVYEVEEDAFRYTGDNWNRHANGIRMKFSDLIEFYLNDIKSRKEIKNLTNISSLAKQHATYYFGVYQGILKHLKNEKIQLKNNGIQKNYVIIIDEINRANISRVFGELITLIESDKRYNGSIPIEAKLPSGDTFIVPSNLYIIGTMNTADKSIALLDIALRRRFEFEAMYPKYEIDEQEIYDVGILRKINEQIIKSKGHDFQIGHSYFMGDNKDLIQRMNKKVIPLLLEYYMNDEKEVIGILKSAGLNIEENSWPIRITGLNGKSI